MQVEVMSWNIWMGKNLEQVGLYIEESGADVIGLQEVIETPDGRKTTNHGEILAVRLGYNLAFYPAFKGQFDNGGAHFWQGNAILSRMPIKGQSGHLLSELDIYQNTAETQPRILVQATVNKEGQEDLDVFCTHLAYSPRFRRSEIRTGQLARLLDLIPAQRALLMGDFNCPSGSEDLARIKEGMINADPNELLQPTWTVHPFSLDGHIETGLVHRLDHIFVTPDLVSESFRIGESRASDHLSIHASLRV